LPRPGFCFPFGEPSGDSRPLPGARIHPVPHDRKSHTAAKRPQVRPPATGLSGQPLREAALVHPSVSSVGYPADGSSLVARTQGAPIAEAIGATEDAATGGETPSGTRRHLRTGVLGFLGLELEPLFRRAERDA